MKKILSILVLIAMLFVPSPISAKGKQRAVERI